MNEFVISVRDKVPRVVSGVQNMVCDNGNYTISLDLDSEWDDYRTLTVLFVLPRDSGTVATLCTGRTCAVPVVSVPGTMQIGITAGEVLRTSRPAEIYVRESIRTKAGEEVATVPPDVTQQIIDRIDALEKGGGGSGGGTAFEPGNALEMKDFVLNVVTTNEAEQDNTLPITSAGVYGIVGNINALLKTI